MGNRDGDEGMGSDAGRREGNAFGLNEDVTPSPMFIVSVAAKGLSPVVSLLFATLAGKSISVAAKGVRGAICWRESNGEPSWAPKGSSEEGSFGSRCSLRMSMLHRTLS